MNISSFITKPWFYKRTIKCLQPDHKKKEFHGHYIYDNIKFVFCIFLENSLYYSETLNYEYIERIHQMSYSSLSDNGMLQIFSFWLNDYMEFFKTVPAYSWKNCQDDIW